MTVTVKSNAWPYKVKESIDSGDVLNYGIDWNDWLPTDAAIQTATWAVTGGTAVHSTVVAGVTYVWLSVTVGATKIQATVHVTLDTSPIPLQVERTLIITVKEK